MKFHFKTQQGHKFLTNAEADAAIGKSRETYQEELVGAGVAKALGVKLETARAA